MDDVELKPIAGETTLGLAGPNSAAVLDSLGAEISDLEPLTAKYIQIADAHVRVERAHEVLVPHFTLWMSKEKLPVIWQALKNAGATPCGLAASNTLRVLEGIPAYGVDLGEKELPQESSQIRALNFSKGCYIGQEIVERIRSRGNVHRNLKQFRLTGEIPMPETELRQGEAVVGQITSVAAIPQKEGELRIALGIVRNEALVRKAPIEYPGGTAEVLETPPAVTLQD
jgi:folate-binding protein YgfZ